MIARATAVSCLMALSAVPLSGCDPYQRRDGEFLEGSVDPVKFPQAYLGVGGSGKMPGQGLIIPSAAMVAGKAVAYYTFPVPASVTDPTDVTGTAPPNGYVFDPSGSTPIPAKAKCAPPANYKYDPQRDAVHFDQQGNIFTDLPSDPAYTPIIAEVAVTSDGEPCQDIKSETTLLTRQDVKLAVVAANPSIPDSMPTATPDGKFLAWPIIDPAARVLSITDDPNNPPLDATEIQQWGYYNHYLLAYLDGGYVPTMPDAMKNLHFVAQNVYVPTLVPGTDKNGKPAAVPGTQGGGFDLLDAARTDAAYSPLCAVNTYVPPLDGTGLPTLVTDATKLTAANMVTPTGNYIYCLQLQ